MPPSESAQNLVQSLERLLAQGEMQLVFDQLQSYLVSVPDLRDEVVLLTARYNRLNRCERKGVVTHEEALVEENRLTSALLALLKEIPAKMTQPMSPASVPTTVADDVTIPEEVGLEKILGINNLKQISWIERGLRVARSVCRVLTPDGLGTAFLISSDLVMTCHHVIPDLATATQSVIEFNYQQDFQGNPLPSCRYKLAAKRFHTSPVLDYSIIGVLPDPSKPNLDNWGYTPLNPNADPVPDEHVIIVQHPNGGLKQIALTANQVIGLWEHRLHYTTDTMPGSSGSPVFNDLWQVIALHHAGGDLQTNAKGDRRFTNEGVLMSAIRDDAGDFWPNHRS